MRAHYSTSTFAAINNRVVDLPEKEHDWLRSQLGDSYAELKHAYFYSAILDHGLYHQVQIYVNDENIVTEVGTGVWCEAHDVDSLNEFTMLKNDRIYPPGFQLAAQGDEIVYRMEVPRMFPEFKAWLQRGITAALTAAPGYYAVANGSVPLTMQQEADMERNHQLYKLLCNPDPNDVDIPF